jgi:hypothetical protein
MYLARSFTLESAGNLKATKAVDKVYALLGMSSDREALGIIPDYSKPWWDVYTEAARALIAQGHIDILSLCRCQYGASKLPSWVPDWTQVIRKP